MKRFSEEHEWVELVEGTATVGITAYAASELGDITFIELPETGVVLGQGEVLCVVESVSVWRFTRAWCGNSRYEDRERSRCVAVSSHTVGPQTVPVSVL